ncbi:MAG: HD domain-containing protein, partial [Gemmatimonadetes bacterium]|nr:HD domain-containing protein [Gemmatimonadota bacterium]
MIGGLGGGGILALGDDVFQHEYEVLDLLGSGNSGEVYRLSHQRHGSNRVIKLFVPFYQLRQARLNEPDQSEHSRHIIEAARNSPYQKREYSFLSRIDHPFIVKVHDYGRQLLNSNQRARLQESSGAAIGGGNIELPFIIAMYVEGADLKRRLGDLSRLNILKVLRSIAEAIDYIHVEHNLLHLDIKSGNVRVRSDGYPVLLDFALSQDLSDEALEQDEDVRGGIDWDLTPFRYGTSNIAEFIQRTQTEGIPRREFRDEAFPGLDLYQVGLMMRDCAGEISAALTPAEVQSFIMLTEQLTSWNQIKQHDPGSLASLFQKIDATHIYFNIRPGTSHGGKEIVLSADRRVFVPPQLVPVVEHAELTRLNRLNQLSLLSSEFAGATHSRYEHSLDVLRLAQSAVRRLSDDPRFRQIFDEKDIEMLLISALLHDINHLPMMHLYQESDLNLLRDQESQMSRDLFAEALQEARYGQRSLADVISETLSQDPVRLHRILESPWKDQTSDADRIISSLIDSGLDLDKLSYLRLDSERSGLGFAGGIDVPGLLEAMSVVEFVRRDDGQVADQGLHVAFHVSSLPLIETLAMARTRAFHDLYWCDENRAMMAQVLACARAIYNISDDGEILNSLMVRLRGETEFSVLQRLDALAKETIEHDYGLAS